MEKAYRPEKAYVTRLNRAAVLPDVEIEVEELEDLLQDEEFHNHYLQVRSATGWHDEVLRS